MQSEALKKSEETITRSEIESYREAEALAKAAERSHTARRKELVRKVKAGARVEIGPWIPQVVKLESRRFSEAALARLIGADATERLKLQLTPTTAELFGLIAREGWQDPDASDDVDQ